VKGNDSGKSREHASLLLRKAAQDEYVLDKLLDDAHAPVEVFGFHGQQAAEKLFKAALVCHGASYPRTHRLTELIDLLLSAGVADAKRFDDLRVLTPFAVEFRYDVIPNEGEPALERGRIRARLGELRTWVESLLVSR
jgi:HEPN domain-containing protein